MSQLTPVFEPSGSGSSEGAVPDPGTTAGTSRFLREDATWAVPVAGPPGPPAPSPGPSLDQWACNAAGYILYDMCYKLVKAAVDTNLITLGTNAIIAFAFDGLAGILLPLEIVDTAFLSWLENWVAMTVQANIATFEAHLLDQALWSKFHCFLYNQIRTAGTVTNTVLLAAGTALAASGITPSLVTNGVALILQQFGVMSIGPIPASAFITNYDCSTCAGTGADSAPIPLQPGFDLIVFDGTNRQAFVDELSFTNAKVTASDRTADIETDINVQQAGVLVGSRPTMNIMNGANITTTVTDNPTDNRVDITIAAAGGGSGSLLVSAFYIPATDTSSTFTNSADADLDATHLTITFTAPAGGAVRVRFEASCGASSAGFFWTVRKAGVAVGSALVVDDINACRSSFTSLVTGLTAGTSYTFTWGGYVTGGGNGVIYHGPHFGTDVLEVWEA